MSDAQAAIFVYDSTSEASFTSLDGWLDVVKKSNSNRLPPSLLIGTKADYSAMRQVPPEIGQNFAKKVDGKFFQLNALNFQQVEEALNTLANSSK